MESATWLQLGVAFILMLIGVSGTGITVATIVARAIGKTRDEAKADRDLVMGLIEQRRTERVEENRLVGGAIEAHRNQDREEFRAMREEMAALIETVRGEARDRGHAFSEKAHGAIAGLDSRMDQVARATIGRQEFETFAGGMQRQLDTLAQQGQQLAQRFDGVVTQLSAALAQRSPAVVVPASASAG